MNRFSTTIEIKAPRIIFIGNAPARGGGHGLELIPKAFVVFPEGPFDRSLLQFDVAMTLPNGQFRAADECEVRTVVRFRERIVLLVSSARDKAQFRGDTGTLKMKLARAGEGDECLLLSSLSMPFGGWQRNIIDVIQSYGAPFPSTVTCGYLLPTSLLHATVMQIDDLVNEVRGVYDNNER